MVGHHQHGLEAMSGASRSGARRRTRRSRRLWAVEGLEGRVLLSGGPTIYTVNAITDTGAGSGTTGDLLYCINQANANLNTAGSEIEFDPTVFATQQTITLGSTLVLSETAGPEVIDGPGSSLATVSGNNAVKVFYVASGVTASLSGLTISGGSAQDGGGIENDSGTMTVTNSTFDSNSGGRGGGIFNMGTMTVTNSTFDNNSGGIVNWIGGTMTVTNSTFENNSDDVGGGIDNAGRMTVTNSTFAYNNAGFGGGIDDEDGTMTVTNSTIADNSAGWEGGGLGVDGGTATLDNTIVALNSTYTTARLKSPDIFLINGGTVSSTSAYNLIGTGGTGGLVDGVNGNQVGVGNPGLSALGDYGGPTQTIALLPGSPAIDAGSNALAVDPTSGQPLTTDQRGPGFVRIYNNVVDIGAFEVQPTADLVVTTQPPANVTAGAGFGVTVTAVDSSGNVDSSFNGTVTVALDNNPGAATVAGTLTVTAQSGVATFSGLTLNKADTGYTLLISDTGMVPATTSAFNVTPAAATQLVVTTQPPRVVSVGETFSLVASAEDPYGNVDGNFDGSVAVGLAANPGGATFGGTLSVTAQNGVASFSGLTLDRPGIGYTLNLSSSGLLGATTNAIDVFTGPAI